MCGWIGVGDRNTTSGGSNGYRSENLTWSLHRMIREGQGPQAMWITLQSKGVACRRGVCMRRCMDVVSCQLLVMASVEDAELA